MMKKKTDLVNKKRLRRGLDIESTEETLFREEKTIEIGNKIKQAKIIKKESMKGKEIRSIQYTLFPSTKQKKILRNWFGVARKLYNEGINDMKNNNNKLRSLEELRTDYIYKDSKFALENKWSLEVPKEVRTGSFRDLQKAISSNFAKKKHNQEHKWEMRYKSRKSLKETIEIPQQSFKLNIKKDKLISTTIYTESLGTILIGNNKQKIVTPFGDIRLTLDRGSYYISIPYLVNIKTVTLDGSKIVSIDPGIRTFLSIYSPNGISGEIGSNIDFLEKTQRRINRIKSFISQSHGIRKKRLKIKSFKLQHKIENKRKDIHFKIANFLCKNFDTIIIGNLGITQIASTKLNKKTKRRMYLWGHYQFKQRLQSIAKKEGKVVGLVDESYTSKTCGNCGFLHEKLGSSKVFNCPYCKHKEDRDIGAARKILLRCCLKD